MTRGGGKRAAVSAALLLIALAGVAALASFDSGIGGIAAAQATTDYDDDDDGLIDVRTLAQLNAIRHDLNGNGDATFVGYVQAFPNRDTNAATRMGCPSGTCTGYELRADLDFDTDDDGDVDSNDPGSYPNFEPIGNFTTKYTAEFKGNNRTISNLTMTTHNNHFRIGLFDTLSASAVVTGVGLVDVNINISTLLNNPRGGALAGFNEGTIRSSYSTGSLAFGAGGQWGGLVGTVSGGSVEASWSSANVSGAGATARVGGLAGQLGFSGTNGTVTASYAAGSATAAGSNARAGGLVGYISTSGSRITASYSIGPVSASGTGSAAHAFAPALPGFAYATGTSNSYWDATTTGIADDADGDSPEGKTTRELQSPRPYTGIYSAWNVNVDGSAGNDDPWDFGQAMQRPMLKWDGMNLPRQGSLSMGMPDADSNGLAPTVGRMARVCLTTGPVLRQPGTGGQRHQPWVWQRSTSWSRSLGDAGWANIAEDGGGTYEYTPVSADRGRYLRACVPVVSSDARARGTDRACVGPFAPVE